MGRMEGKKNTQLVPYRYKQIEQNGSVLFVNYLHAMNFNI